MSSRCLHVSMILVGIDGDMILIINRQSKTTFINLLKDFIDSILQLCSNLSFTPIIEINKFLVDSFSICFVNFCLFVALIKKGKLSTTSVCTLSTPLRIATVPNAFVSLSLTTTDYFVTLLNLRVNCPDFCPDIVTSKFLFNSMKLFRKVDNLILLLANDT